MNSRRRPIYEQSGHGILPCPYDTCWPRRPTAIGLVSLNPNSETHMTAICDARLTYGRGRVSRAFICGGTDIPNRDSGLWIDN